MRLEWELREERDYYRDKAEAMAAKIRHIITELREKPWHQTPEQVANRLEGILEDKK